MSAILCHTNISEVVSKYPPKPVQNLTLTPGKFLVSLTWEDPTDYTEEGYTCTWAKTIVVRKQGGYPNDIHDGTVVVTTVERDKYKTSGYEDTGLTGGETYYYRVFTCSTDGVYGSPAEGNCTPKSYKVMTVKINLANSNPATCGSYADDAVGMEFGKTASAVAAWQEFFGYKPCLFKEGKVVGYLNPNDFTKFENGRSADITSGNAGDVMIEFPRHGVRISKSGKVVTVSMTNDPNDPSFKYYAHQRGSVNKDYFYLGAYLGSLNTNTLGLYAVRSLSGTFCDNNQKIAYMYEYAQHNGDGYGVMCFYQWLYIQVMYVLQYRGNLNSQVAHGYGLCDYGTAYKSGSCDKRGMMYGMRYSSSTPYPLKLFGLEDLWGNHDQFLNNVYIAPTSSGFHVFTTTDDTITDPSKYTDVGYYAATINNINNYFTMCIGNSECGFIVDNSTSAGSSSTYFCDSATIIPDNGIPVAIVGGSYNSEQDFEGIFYFNLYFLRDYADSPTVRLQYL